MTEKGSLDFHAFRTAHINFVIDAGANVITAQELARHQTLEMTMNIYGQARDVKMRETVEAVASMLYAED